MRRLQNRLDGCNGTGIEEGSQCKVESKESRRGSGGWGVEVGGRKKSREMVGGGVEEGNSERINIDEQRRRAHLTVTCAILAAKGGSIVSG